MGGILTSGMGGLSNSVGPRQLASRISWFAYSLGTDTQVWQQQGTDNIPSGGWTRVTP
jgi:hypothetical protein